MPENNMSTEKDSRLNVIEVRDVTVQLGGQTILDRINIDVRQGTIHAVLGPNGAGKPP